MCEICEWGRNDQGLTAVQVYELQNWYPEDGYADEDDTVE